MLNMTVQPRHWSPREGYATGDVLLRLIDEGWHIAASQDAPGQRRAPMFIVTLRRGEDVLTVLVIDGPVARSLLPGREPLALNA